MAVNKNAYGLVRDIPAAVSALVRERCGYGCIVCGSLIYQYHHNEIQFHEAKKHDPDYMMLLCANCHQQAGHSISHKRLTEQMEHPFCKREEFGLIRNFLHPSAKVNFRWGESYIEDCPIILAIDGTRIIWMDPPERAGAPFRLSASFCFERGPFARINQNELVVTTNPGWDIRTVNMERIDNDIILKQLSLHYPGNYSVTVQRNNHKLNLECPIGKLSIGKLNSGNNGVAIHLRADGFAL